VIGGYVGTSVPRFEDLDLVTGDASFVDNLRVPGTLHAVLVRSPFAHARVGGVDVRPALAVPGVVAAFSGRDLLGDWAGPLPMIWRVGDDTNVPEHWPLATDEAKHAGDPVAVVVADSVAVAMDGAESVLVEYEPLPAVVDLEAALDADAPLVHPQFGTNRCFTLSYSYGEDVAEILRDAEVRVSRTLRQQRVIPSPMEPRGVLAEPRPAGEFILWTSTQIPHIVKRTLAPCVGLQEHRLRVIAPDVGGGFGAKLNVYAEEAMALTLARRLGRPIKWVEERSEHSFATTHGRGQVQQVELAATRDGTITGIRVSVHASMGAYLQLETPGIPIIGRFLFTGAYRALGYRYECTGVFTNQTPTGAYRGAGRPEAAYAIERMMDILAREIGRDPAEVRRINFLAPGQGIENAAGIAYDSVDYHKTLDRALELVDYQELRADQARRRASSASRSLGIGISCYVDAAGIGPSAVLSKTLYQSGGWEYAGVRILPSGAIEVLTGTSPQGQGHDTVFAQIAAETLGVDVGDVKVHHGDTAIVPIGTGTFGSRSVVVGGSAVHLAAIRVLEKAKKVAAHVLEAAREDLVFSEGRFAVAGAPDRTVSLGAVARAAYLAHDLPQDVEPGLHDEFVLDPQDWTYPFGAHVAVVDVDTETGEIQVVRYTAVDDCGQVINPTIVEGQVHGGIVQGIGQALFEEASYTADGQLETASFMNYLIPSATELPALDVDRTVTSSPLNPLGAKGVGEAGAIAAPPAVMNAIHDAIRVDEIDMPASPERVWRAIRDAARSPAARLQAGVSPRGRQRG
jgi:carbon-monoxide dehydrogenase large subunit